MQKHPHTIINNDNAHAMITLILTRFAHTKFLLFSIRFPHKKIKKRPTQSEETPFPKREKCTVWSIRISKNNQ
jgi:hypothetical protein